MQRRTFLLAMLLGGFPAFVNATPPALRVLTVSGQDAEIVTQAGLCPVYLKGMDLSGLEYSCTGDTGAAKPTIVQRAQAAMTEWGANFVRVPLNQDSWLGTGCGCNTASYQALADSIVATVSATNGYVLFDLHWNDLGTPGGNQVCSSGQHDMPDLNSVAFWTSVAHHYANNPAVFFDLYNEPGGGKGPPSGCSDITSDATGWNFWLNGGTETAAASTCGALPDGVAYYTPGMQGLLNAVRAAGASNMVWAGGRSWALDLSGLPGGTWSGGKTYWLQDVTWGAGVVYATHPYPWSLGDAYDPAPSNFDATVLGNAANVTAILQHAPVMITEFGPNVPTPTNSSTDPQDFVPATLAWVQSRQLPFCAWELGSAGPSLVCTTTPNVGYDLTPNPYFGAPVMTAIAGAPGDNSCIPPTSTATPTISPTATTSPTFTVSSTFTVSPTRSASPTISPTFTVSPTFTISPTMSDSPTPVPFVPGALPPQVFPNPFRADGTSVAYIARLEAGSSIRIFDLLGRKVRGLTASGDPALATWIGTNDNGRQVATGVYLLVIEQPSGRKDILRLAVLRH